PRENLIVAWSNAFKVKVSRRVRRRRPIEVESTATRSVRDQYNCDINRCFLFVVSNSAIDNSCIRADEDVERSSRLPIQAEAFAHNIDSGVACHFHIGIARHSTNGETVIVTTDLL